jgi:hypothetical protein
MSNRVSIRLTGHGVDPRQQLRNLHSIKHFRTEPTRRDFGMSDARIDATNDSYAATVGAGIVGTHSSTEEITTLGRDTFRGPGFHDFDGP